MSSSHLYVNRSFDEMSTRRRNYWPPVSTLVRRVSLSVRPSPRIGRKRDSMIAFDFQIVITCDRGVSRDRVEPWGH